MSMFLEKTLTSNVSNDDHDMLVELLFSSDDDDDVLTSAYNSVRIDNGHLWSLIMPYLGSNGSN